MPGSVSGVSKGGSSPKDARTPLEITSLYAAPKLFPFEARNVIEEVWLLDLVQLHKVCWRQKRSKEYVSFTLDKRKGLKGVRLGSPVWSPVWNVFWFFRRQKMALWSHHQFDQPSLFVQFGVQSSRFRSGLSIMLPSFTAMATEMLETFWKCSRGTLFTSSTLKAALAISFTAELGTATGNSVGAELVASGSKELHNNSLEQKRIDNPFWRSEWLLKKQLVHNF